jgi:hypothetical protein
MGIVFGVTIPRFGGLLGGGGPARFSKELAAYLRNARELAVVRNAPVRVEVEPGGSRVVVTGVGRGLEPLEVPEDMEIELELQARGAEAAIVFYPLGNATPGRIVLEAPDGRSMAVGIEGLTGDVYVE